MDIKIEDFYKILNKYPLDTKSGLVYFFITWLILLGIVYKIFLNIFLSLYFAWSILFIIFLLWWLYRRERYSYWLNKLYVIFAVTIPLYEDKKLLRIYKELINHFKKDLKDYKLSQDVKIKIKPVDIEFSDHSAAEAKTKLNFPCSTLIISGLPITSEEEVKFKFNFHYEFIYHGDKSNESYYKDVFHRTIDKALHGRNWTVQNNIKSKESVYMNTFKASTYILSLCLSSLGKADEAIKLLKPIRDECNQNIYKKEYGPLIADVKSYLYKIIEIKFDNSYFNLKIEELKPLAEEMERLGKYEYTTYMAKAIVHELDGDRNKAKEYTQKAEYSHPKCIFDFKFNYLYFNLVEGNYSEAVKILKEMEDSIKDRNIMPIINFLYNRYEKTDNLALLFNIGSVILIWGEIRLGKKELNKFIREAKNSDNYKILLDESHELLSKYKK